MGETSFWASMAFVILVIIVSRFCCKTFGYRTEAGNPELKVPVWRSRKLDDNITRSSGKN
jgi:hypothetical protein